MEASVCGYFRFVYGLVLMKEADLSFNIKTFDFEFFVIFSVGI